MSLPSRPGGGTAVYQHPDRTWSEPSASFDFSRLKIDERRDGDVTLLKLSGEMLLDDGDLAFRTHINKLLTEGRTKIVVNLSELRHMDSSGVGMLLTKLQKLRQADGDLRLAQLSPRYQRLLTTMRVMSLFQVF